MAYRSTGRTNLELILNMQKNKMITADGVAVALKKVDRANYVLDKESAYEDSPQYIQYGATISAPHMHASAAENLLPFLNPGARVLDVGSGSGYTAAIFHHLVSSASGSDPDANASENVPGKVVGIDHISELVSWSKENLAKDGLGAALESGEIEMIEGDGRKGHPPSAPYDAIHVGAAAPSVPTELLAQLNSPGRMFIPVGEKGEQEILQIDKDESGRVTEKRLFGVRYVPLTDMQKQRAGAR